MGSVVAVWILWFGEVISRAIQGQNIHQQKARVRVRAFDVFFSGCRTEAKRS